MLKKELTVGIILIFILSSLIPMVSSNESNESNVIYVDDGTADYNRIHCKIENGSLSGFVNDSFFNPIEGALVSIKCGGLHMQNISDSTGFYYIDNVPIVDCYWNVSASKDEYDTSWVEMAIDINSTYDFILTSSNNIIYVGGNGPNNYSRIQDAVNNASDGDTVYVYSGTYYENLIIDISIILQAEDNSNTVIDGNKNGNVIHIIADEVTISDFTLQHYGTIWFDSGIKIESDDNTITNNNIYGNYDGACYNSTGIYVINSNHNFVENNHILHNSYGIYNTDSKLSIFSANQIINNNDGICILNSNNNEIKNNEFIKNNCAIVLHSSNGNSIYTNNIKLGRWVGIDLNGANTNTIKRNNIIENSRYGLRIRWSKYNVVTENNFIQNYEQAFLLSSQRTAINNNYWDDWNNLFLPRPINCTINLIYMVFIPWFKFDWHPAQEPYDIS